MVLISYNLQLSIKHTHTLIIHPRDTHKWSKDKIEKMFFRWKATVPPSACFSEATSSKQSLLLWVLLKPAHPLRICFYFCFLLINFGHLALTFYNTMTDTNVAHVLPLCHSDITISSSTDPLCIFNHTKSQFSFQPP